MIEDKKLGLKIAPTKDHAFWEQLRKNQETEIFNSKKSIEIAKEIMLICERKLKELNK